MKTIGLIGGMSWESTVTYYQIINEIVKKELGGLHSAKCILYSVDFDEIERCQSAGAWEKSGEILGKAAENLEAAGADFILICTNTMHKVFEQVQRYVNIPFIHIAQATADVLKRENITRVGLLGTKYTMEQDFYKGKLAENGISVVIPDADDIETVNSIIFHELCVGKIEDKSRKKYGKGDYLPKTAHAANFGTAGFLLSTASYALIYHRFGLKGLLIATVLSGAAGFICALLLRRDSCVSIKAAGRTERAGLSQLLLLLRDRRARQFTVLMSLFSVAWLLVNFFYAEILVQCGIPLVWLSAIIIGYSLAQMLAEPLIHLLGQCAKQKLTIFFCLLSGAVLVGFGLLHKPWVLILMMAFLPLFLDLAAFYVEEQQNHLIDTLKMESDRAAALSVMNMGVNLVEILSLFASSLLVAVGIGWCFGLCGAVLILSAVLCRRKSGDSF